MYYELVGKDSNGYEDDIHNYIIKISIKEHTQVLLCFNSLYLRLALNKKFVIIIIYWIFIYTNIILFLSNSVMKRSISEWSVTSGQMVCHKESFGALLSAGLAHGLRGNPDASVYVQESSAALSYSLHGWRIAWSGHPSHLAAIIILTIRSWLMSSFPHQLFRHGPALTDPSINDLCKINKVCQVSRVADTFLLSDRSFCTLYAQG